MRRSMAGLSGKPRHKASAWRQVAAPLAGDRSLRGLAALKRLKPEQREALQRRLEVREYRRAELIYQPGQEARSLYVVLAGVARLSIPSPNGRRRVLLSTPRCAPGASAQTISSRCSPASARARSAR